MVRETTSRNVSSPLTPTAALSLNDVIIAQATPPGPGARAILRMTGPQCWSLVRPMLLPENAPEHFHKGRFPVQVRLQDFYSPLPVTLQLWPGPRTYTGQDLIELHTIGSPPLTQALMEQILTAGARLAKPGEFTLRAFLSGKLDLTQAEAVLAMTSVNGEEELKIALEQLAGGMARPLEKLRDELLYVLAEVEAGLDFVEEDISFIAQDELIHRLERTGAALAELRQSLQRKRISEKPFKLVLTGAPNAGKSSLFNVLIGKSSALVSDQAGTTRDYLSETLTIQGMPLEIIDTAGFHESPITQQKSHSISEEAEQFREEQVQQADLILLCMDASRGPSERDREFLAETGERTLPVFTKCDLREPDSELDRAIRVSSLTGAGLATLRLSIADFARKVLKPTGIAPGMTRCVEQIDQALENVERATDQARYQNRMELVASELRLALDAIGTIVGSVYSEDLLDRIFSQFCIGK